MPVYDDEKQHTDDDLRHHDDLGVHPEHREAEIDDLEKQFGAESAPEHDYGNEEAAAGSSSAKGIGAGIASAAGLKKSEEDSGTLGKGYTGSGKDAGPEASGAMAKLKNFRARLRSDDGFRKKVMMTGAGAGVGTGLVIVIIILFLIVSMFKIPGLAQNIVNFQFARMSRQFQQATTRTTEEELAVEGASEAADATAANPGGVFGALKDKYGTLKDGLFEKIDGVLPGNTTIGSINSKLDTVLPSRVINTLQDDHGLTFNYKTSKLTGRPILQSMELDGETYPMEQASGLAKWTPILKNVVGVKNQAKFASDVLPVVQTAMTDEGVGNDAVGIFTREIVANQLRQAAGINLIAWNVNRFVGKDPVQARLEEESQKYSDIENSTNEADLAATSELDNAQTDAQSTEQQDMSNPKTEQQIINNGGVDQAAIDASEKDVSPNLESEAANLADPFFSLTVSACIIYDGSVQQSGGTINNQTTQEESAFYYVSSAADQQKAGSQSDTVGQSYGLANAIGATNTDLGDVSTSNAYQRANGGTVSTSTNVSAEAGSDGGYNFSILDALGITDPNSTSGKLVNWFISHGCHVLTNTATAIGIGVAGIISSIVTFGGSEAGAETLGEGAGVFLRAYVQHVVDSIFGTQVEKQGLKTITKGFIARARPYIIKQGLILGGTVGLTVLAHIITAARSGEFFGGLNQGKDLADEADAGGNFTSNQEEQTQLFGRPLLMDEVCSSNTEDLKYVGQNQSQQSAFVRYFSPSNAESLFSKTAVAVTGQINMAGLNNFMTLGTMMLRPYTGMNYFLNAMTGLSHAAPNCNADASEYGQVQFGWADDEEKLIDSSPSYMPLENQKILDESNQENTIAQTYAVCFGYDYNGGGDGSLDPTDPNGNLRLNIYGNGSIGSLLASGDIQRDSDGNVLNQGLCAKDHLSYNNTADPFAADNDPSSPQKNDLVFRWRLAMQYDTTVDEDMDVQNVTAN